VVTDSAFALGTFRTEHGTEFPGVVVDGRVRRIDAPNVAALLAGWDAALAYVGELAGSASSDWRPLDSVTPAPPLAPGQILQAGANYRQHVIDLVVSESDDDGQGRTPEEKRAYGAELMDRRAAEGTPYVFLGSPSALCGATDDIVLPAEGHEHDWELELALVIGRPGRRIDPADALDHVAAYTIANDITTRDRLYRADLAKLGADWVAAKNSPTFLPVGPHLVPATFVKDPMDLRITLRHNGTVRQDESTSDMLFDIPRLISYASELVALRPGDLLLTGSPAGNGAHWGVFLSPGDVLDAEITGLGAQRNTCVAEVLARAEG
jgi:2-keto-4-pentenoate hydratase/2-oxohepta-3-ene-1,7-dioic acid hydratase in catechol pathway